MAGLNYLSSMEFRFSINRLPKTEFYIQSVTMPGINSGSTPHPTPFKTTYRHGDKLEYDELIVTCVVDERMEGYQEVWNWLVDLTKGRGRFTDYQKTKESDEGLYSDATLTILNSSKNANIEITFQNLFPVSVSSIELDTKQTDITPPVVNFTFRYDSYSIGTI